MGGWILRFLQTKNNNANSNNNLKINSRKKLLDRHNNDDSDLPIRIYSFIKYSYTNPLSLKEIARISIRNYMLNAKIGGREGDCKMKFKIEKSTCIKLVGPVSLSKLNTNLTGTNSVLSLREGYNSHSG